MTSYPELDQELIKKLIKLHDGRPSPPSPPPTPFSDLSVQLKNEISITTNFLKSFFNEGSLNLKPIVFSPAVISSSLAMLLSSKSAAENQETIEEIENVFGKDFGNSDEIDLNGIIFLRTLIYSKKLSLLDSFEKYKTDDKNLLLKVDFENNLDEIIKEINSIVSNKTNKKISKLFDASDISPNMSFCLGTAATFVDQWCFSFPFDSPKSATFWSNPPRQMDFIRQKEKELWNFSEGEDWTCMNILYGNPDVQRMLYIILPKEKDGLEKVIEKFDYTMIRDCNKGTTVTAIATIPIFEIESNTILNDKLKEIGIKKLFENNASDKTITNDAFFHGLDLAVHAARIKVDQFGADGRDDTEDHLRLQDLRIQPGYMVPKPGCREIEFVADRPFIFFVALPADISVSKIGLQSIQFAGIFS